MACGCFSGVWVAHRSNGEELDIDYKEDKTGNCSAAGSWRKAKLAIRVYQPEDRHSVRDICLYTAFRNMGTNSLFEDRELSADYWTLYYTDYEPESIWIAELDGSVVGYCFGCLDTARYMKNMAARIMPTLLLKTMWRWGNGCTGLSTPVADPEMIAIACSRK